MTQMTFRYLPVESWFKRNGVLLQKVDNPTDEGNAVDTAGVRHRIGVDSKVEWWPAPFAGDYVIRAEEVTSDAGRGLSVKTPYRVVHRQDNGLLTLEGYLMVVPDYDTRKVFSSDAARYAGYAGKTIPKGAIVPCACGRNWILTVGPTPRTRCYECEEAANGGTNG